MLWGGESSERVRLEHLGEGTPAMGFVCINLDSAVGAKQSSGKLLMLNQCLCLESSTMANPFGEVL